jgi:sugar/nucleoside kinase (ribokinase family)
MRQHIAALTHPLTDLIVPCSQDFLDSHNLKPGSYGMLSETEQNELLQRCSILTPTASAGGSAANSVQTANLIGVAGSILGLLGDDYFGNSMRAELEAQGIAVPLSPVPNATTGTCVSLITPDGERTMRTHLGIAKELGTHHISTDVLKDSSWLLLEGYFLTASQANAQAMMELIKLARAQGIKIAFTVAAEFVVDSKRVEIEQEIFPNIDLLIANEGEAMALAEVTTPQDALRSLRRAVDGVIITCGKDGALGSMSDVT